MRRNLRRALRELSPLAPDFVSVTYGAGGTTRDRTVDIVASLRQEFGLEAMAHFTCVNATVDDLRTTLDRMRDAGAENVLALRGDPPDGSGSLDRRRRAASSTPVSSSGSWRPTRLLRSASPATPRATSQCLNRRATSNTSRRRSTPAGSSSSRSSSSTTPTSTSSATRARDGHQGPDHRGHHADHERRQIKRFSELCGAKIPARLRYALESRADEPEAVSELGVANATLQCAQLLANGAPGVHFSNTYWNQ